MCVVGSRLSARFAYRSGTRTRLRMWSGLPPYHHRKRMNSSSASHGRTRYGQTDQDSRYASYADDPSVPAWGGRRGWWRSCQSAYPGEFAPAHPGVVLGLKVVGAGEMVHAVGDVEQQLLRRTPTGATRRGAKRLVGVDEKLAVQTGRLGRDRVVRLG